VTGSIARCRERWCPRRKPEAAKDSSGHGRVGDRRKDSHPSATFWTGKRIDLEDALKKFGPRNAVFQNEFFISR
jgi:hypothetical protein